MEKRSHREKNRLILPPIPKGPVCLVSQGVLLHEVKNTTEGAVEGRKYGVSRAPRANGHHYKGAQDFKQQLQAYSMSTASKELPTSREDDTSGDHLIQSQNPGPSAAKQEPLYPDSKDDISYEEPTVLPQKILTAGEVNTRPVYTVPTEIELAAKDRADKKGRKRYSSLPDFPHPKSLDFQMMEGFGSKEVKPERGQEPRKSSSPSARRPSLHRTLEGSRSLPFRSRRVGVCEPFFDGPGSQSGKTRTLPITTAANYTTGNIRLQHGNRPLQLGAPAPDSWNLPERSRRHGLCDSNDSAASERMKARVLHKRFAKVVSQKEIDESLW